MILLIKSDCDSSPVTLTPSPGTDARRVTSERVTARGVARCLRGNLLPHIILVLNVARSPDDSHLLLKMGITHAFRLWSRRSKPSSIETSGS